MAERPKKQSKPKPKARRTAPRSRRTTGYLTPAEIQFAQLVAKGGMSASECAAKAGLVERRRDGIALRDVPVRKWTRNPLVIAEVARFRRVLSEAAKIDADTLAVEFRDRQQLDKSLIYGPDGELLPIHDWPLLHRQMIKSIRHNARTGKIAEVVFQNTEHLDALLSSWTGIIGTALADPDASSKIEVIIEQVAPREALPMPTAEQLEVIDAEVLEDEFRAATTPDKPPEEPVHEQEEPVLLPEPPVEPVDWSRNDEEDGYGGASLDDLKW